MPESVTDRPTNAHEKLFLLTKSPRYFYDAYAVRVPHLPVSLKRIESGLHHTHPADQGVGIPPVDTERMGERFAHAGGRNSRNVWTIPTHSYKGAHFATFPPALVEPCIKAGTSERGVCVECGAPWVRKVERHTTEYSDTARTQSAVDAGVTALTGCRNRSRTSDPWSETKGWQLTCDCGAASVPATVLDPFAGSGTVGQVALSLGRSFIGVEINAEYVKMGKKRSEQTAPLFTEASE